MASISSDSSVAATVINFRTTPGAALTEPFEAHVMPASGKCLEHTREWDIRSLSDSLKTFN